MPTVTANPIERAHALAATLTLGLPIPAQSRLRWARRTARLAAEWPDLVFDRYGRACIERDGFTVVAQFRGDNDPDMSLLGDFTDRWTSGAVKNPAAWDDSGVPNRAFCAWFVPTVSAEDIRMFLRRQGVAKHDAWLQGQREVRDEMARNRDCPDAHVVEVTVSLARVELARVTLGDIWLYENLPWGDVHEQMFDVTVELIGDALADARTKLAELLGAARRVGGISVESFAQRQVRDVLDAGADDSIYRLKVTGATASKWVNVTHDQLTAIYHDLGGPTT